MLLMKTKAKRSPWANLERSEKWVEWFYRTLFVKLSL